ncbi:hypothetical protein ACRALDRAFT_1065025 [Sodiomyces alcalophilus JCM 7366]|uniref:uncharacterized protein n=1 Tax=Sodiomyces alcalophilus JCM 7366 TaxID=591952 RepID=UPI0039B57550
MDSSASRNTSLGTTSKSTALPVAKTTAAAASLLPPPEFPYAGIKDLLEKLSNVEGDTVTFRGVSDKDFNQIYSAREKLGRKFRLSLYTSESQLLLISIPTLKHERLHAQLNAHIERLLLKIQLEDELICTGKTDYRQLDHAGNRKAQGEGDASRKPISLRPEEDDFPTLVIEAGYTQTWPSLRNKARWWFTASNFDVKIILLIKMSLQSPDIDIEKWKAEKSTRPGMTTRAMAAQAQPVLSPVCVQTIAITRAPGLSLNDPRRFIPSSYRVTSGLLRLEFEDLFLRDPRPGEGDLILGTTELQSFAASVWRSLPGR